jgi:hypothetical protein
VDRGEGRGPGAFVITNPCIEAARHNERALLRSAIVGVTIAPPGHFLLALRSDSFYLSQDSESAGFESSLQP